MEKVEKFSEKIKLGGAGYINKNCLLAKDLGYPPSNRCQYCESKFSKCLFFRYLIISLILTIFLLIVSFLIEGVVSKSIIVSIFVLVIVYGYFFNKSTEDIIVANFAQKRAKDALGELTEKLEQKVDEQTKEIKDTYKKLEKAYEELKKLNKAKSEFISIASHQLRTPLTAIKGYISMILENTYGRTTIKMKKPLESVYASNERILKLVNDLLNVSRIESGKLEFKQEKISIESLINDVIEDLTLQAGNKNLYLKFEAPDTSLPKITIDEEKIRQALLNIVDNAIKYTQKGGITIKIKTDNNKCCIQITDTGEGMTQDEISGLFESFSRGKAGNKLWTEGSGLGLYVAKKFIEMHKGRIWTESEGKGKGSTFFIELPIA